MKNIKELLVDLESAEQAVIENINRRMPADDVPDRVAIPLLNQLEAEQQNAEHSFHAVRALLEKLPPVKSCLPSRHPGRNL